MDQRRVKVSISSTTVTSAGVSPSSSATICETIGLVPLALRRRAQDGDDAAERVDLDRRGVDGARLGQVLGLGAELRIERDGHVAHVGDGGIDRQRQADPEEPPGRPRLRPARAAARRSARARAPDRRPPGSRRCRRGRRSASGTASAAARSGCAAGSRPGSSPSRCGEQVHHPLGLEVEVPAGVAAVRARSGSCWSSPPRRRPRGSGSGTARRSCRWGGSCTPAPGCGCSRRRCRAT